MQVFIATLCQLFIAPPASITNMLISSLSLALRMHVGKW